MNRARTTCLLLLLFLAVPPVANADAILNLGDSSAFSRSHRGTSTSDFNALDSSAKVFRTDLAGVSGHRGMRLLLTDAKSGFHSKHTPVAFAQSRSNLGLTPLKNHWKHKNDPKQKEEKAKGGKVHDDDYQPHVVPEPHTIATLATGLALLLIKLRRNT